MKFLLKTRPRATANALTIAPMRLSVPNRPMRVLDFDSESRPLHWINNEYVSQEVTAIAWAWSDRPEEVTCYLLGEHEPVEMLYAFREAYDAADMVTGHYITGHDLPLIQGAMTEYQLPLLSDKLVQDTKVHMVKRKGLSSSQENIAAMLFLAHDKVKMNQAKWRSANRLTPEGIEEARRRVIGDVQQHIEMRRRLIELGYVGRHMLWKGAAAKAEAYTP
jgi:hypothetical protein